MNQNRKSGRRVAACFSLISLCTVWLSLFVPGCDEISSESKVTNADQASPKALVAAYHRATVDKDWSTLAALTSPDFRKPMRSTLNAFKDYSKEADKVADLLEEKVSPESANRLRKETQSFYRELVTSPLDGAVSGDEIQWDRVEIRTDKGNIAWVYINGRKSTFHVLSEVDGRWYVEPLNTPEAFRKVADETIDNINKGTKTWKSVQKAIKKGDITAANVELRLWPTEPPPR